MAEDETTEKRTLAQAAAEFYESESGAKELGQLINKDNAQEKLSELLPTAVRRLEYLLNHAESEAVVWQVTKYILGHNLGNGTEDELSDLLKRITKRPNQATMEN